MNDGEIRGVLDRRLQSRYGSEPEVLIRHEFGVESGNRRIDVAVLNGHLAGWEIKSDEDTLYRLPEQAASYGRVMDYLTLVTTAKYLEKAASKLPDWWGLTEAVQGSSGTKLVSRRTPRINRTQDQFSLAQLLWRDEALAELRLRDQASGLSSKSRYFVWERLAQVTTRKELRTCVLRRLKQRQEWPGGQLQTQYGRSLHK